MTPADITSADWSLMLDSTAAQLGLQSGIGAVVEGFQDVSQCIAIILTTPKGADPLRPTFGCDLWQFIDTPITIATPHIVREVTESLGIWEPRIKVISVTARLAPLGSNNQYGANLLVGVTWQLKLGTSVPPSVLQQRTTIVTITPGLTH
jgi:phage baseplate assembly protein W